MANSSLLVNANMPNISKGAINQYNTQSIVTSLEAAEIYPEHIAELWLSYGNGLLTFSDVLEYALEGRSTLTSAESWTAHTENYPLKTITVGSSVTVSATPGAEATFTLDLNDLTRVGVTSTYYYLPRLYQTVVLGTPGDQVEGWISQIDQTTSTVTIHVLPNNLETLSATYLYTGAIIPLGGIKKSPESSATTGTKVGYDTYTFYANVMKEATGWGPMPLINKRWSQVEGMGLYSRDLTKTEWLMKAGMNISLLMGQAITNPLIVNTSVMDGSSLPVKSNIGLWTWGGTHGYDFTYNQTAGWKVTDMDALAEYYQAIGINTDKVSLICGGGFYRSVENNCKDYITGSTGALNDLFTPRNGQDHDLSIGFKTIHKMGVDFTLVQDPTFNNQQMLKNIMYDSFLGVPLSTEKDMVTGEMMPNVQLRYCGNNTMNRKMVVGHITGMTGQQLGFPIISSDDSMYTHFLTHFGFTVYNPFSITRGYTS